MKRIHPKLSLEQKIQMLTTDFLDRDQTTFVKIRRTGRLDSDGRLGDIPDPKALAEYARDKDMLAVMSQSQAFSLCKELRQYVLMVDTLSEIVHCLLE